MRRKPDIDCVKSECVRFSKQGNLSLPTPRNTLVEEIFENKRLSILLALTMDRLEDKYDFSRYNRIKGCEEFIEYSVARDPEAISYQLRLFAEEILELMKEVEE